jgi:hypothetical protein
MSALTVFELRRALDALENAGKIDGATLVFGHVPQTNETMLAFEVRLTMPGAFYEGASRPSAPERHVRVLLARPGDRLKAEA